MPNMLLCSELMQRLLFVIMLNHHAACIVTHKHLSIPKHLFQVRNVIPTLEI